MQTIVFALQFEHMTELELDTHAAHAAEYFWWTGRRNVQNTMLLKRSLRDKLDSDEEADFAFKLFDVDGDGWVLEDEVQSRFQQIYRCALAIARWDADCSTFSGDVPVLA